MKKGIKLVSLSLLTAFGLSILASCGESKPVDSVAPTSEQTSSAEEQSVAISSQNVVKDKYDFTYNYNYEGGRVQTVKVDAGSRASNVKATRSGYTFGGWYNEPECLNPFDFTSVINADITVYAKWTKNAAKMAVTFDFNYKGSSAPIVMEIEENTLISPQQVPPCSRLGYQYSGWFKDKECTQEWNFNTDLVTGEMTLYAGYNLDPSIPRKADNSIDYTGVSIDVFYTEIFNVGSRLANYAATFKNKTGITVNFSKSIATQDNYALRMQQTPGMNATYANYYNAIDVMNLAGIDFDEEEYFPSLISEGKVNGTLYTIPYGAAPNYLIYNKELMTKYNGTDPLPTKYSEFKALAAKAVAGEENLKSAVVQTDWPWREAASMAPFAQNNIPYYTYSDEGGYATEWGTEEGNARALTALQNFFDWFNPYGANKGGNNTNWNDSETVSAVAGKQALFGLMSQKNVSDVISNEALGVLPLTGFFSDVTSTYGSITNHPLGFSFYKAKNVSLVQLAACAEFVHYCVEEKASDIMKFGCVPSFRSAFDKSSASDTVAALKSIVPSGDLLTNLPGHVSEKALFNQQIAENELLTNVLKDHTDEDLADYIEYIYAKITQTIGI